MADTATSPELVLSHLDSLPTLPAVAIRILQATSADDTGAADIIRLLRADQSLTAKILSRAASAATGARTPVTTLEKAVPRLGFSGVRSIVLSASVFEVFGTPGGQTNSNAFDRAEFWKHSLAVACAAKRLAQTNKTLGVDPEDAFVGGLLHDLGKVAIDTVFPKAYDRISSQANHSRGDIADAERAVLGADHTVAGRRLAERWQLPRCFQEVMWLHHLAAEALPSTVAQPKLIGVVQLADTISREQRIGYSGNYTFYELSPRLADRLGFSSDDIAAVVQPLASDVAAQAQLLGLDEETAEGVYVQAMSRANQELGHLNADLERQNQRLAAGARYFNAVGLFERELTDWSDPTAVVVAVARAGAMALQRPRLAAFGLRDNDSAIDVSWVGETPDDGGHATQSVPLELLNWLEDPGEQAEALALRAPQAIRVLLTSVFGPADDGTLWLLPIWHGGTIAGGLAFLSEGNERDRLASEAEELRSFLASLGLALGRANAQSSARRLSEDLAETNRRLQQMQTELLRSRTLSMIAEMAAGAGHELNSPLSVISGRAQMLSSTTDDPERQRALGLISEKAHECSGIVSELMDFARPRSPKQVAVDLVGLLNDVHAEWLEDESHTPAQYRLLPTMAPRPGDGEDSEAAATAFVDAGQIKEVLRELLSNAAAALEGTEGTVTIRCQVAVEPGALEIIVEDTGRGMSPAVLQRAFDPFYSHHSAGRRRGLGLPRAYRIVEAHGGRIWLESRPGEGTAAHVVLPRKD